MKNPEANLAAQQQPQAQGETLMLDQQIAKNKNDTAALEKMLEDKATDTPAAREHLATLKRDLALLEAKRNSAHQVVSAQAQNELAEVVSPRIENNESPASFEAKLIIALMSQRDLGYKKTAETKEGDTLKLLFIKKNAPRIAITLPQDPAKAKPLVLSTEGNVAKSDGTFEKIKQLSGFRDEPYDLLGNLKTNIAILTSKRNERTNPAKEALKPLSLDKTKFDKSGGLVVEGTLSLNEKTITGWINLFENSDGKYRASITSNGKTYPVEVAATSDNTEAYQQFLNEYHAVMKKIYTADFLEHKTSDPVLIQGALDMAANHEIAARQREALEKEDARIAIIKKRFERKEYIYKGLQPKDEAQRPKYDDGYVITLSSGPNERTIYLKRDKDPQTIEIDTFNNVEDPDIGYVALAHSTEIPDSPNQVKKSKRQLQLEAILSTRMNTKEKGAYTILSDTDFGGEKGSNGLLGKIEAHIKTAEKAHEEFKKRPSEKAKEIGVDTGTTMDLNGKTWKLYRYEAPDKGGFYTVPLIIDDENHSLTFLSPNGTMSPQKNDIAQISSAVIIATVVKAYLDQNKAIITAREHLKDEEIKKIFEKNNAGGTVKGDGNLENIFPEPISAIYKKYYIPPKKVDATEVKDKKEIEAYRVTIQPQTAPNGEVTATITDCEAANIAELYKDEDEAPKGVDVDAQPITVPITATGPHAMNEIISQIKSILKARETAKEKTIADAVTAARQKADDDYEAAKKTAEEEAQARGIKKKEEQEFDDSVNKPQAYLDRELTKAVPKFATAHPELGIQSCEITGSSASKGVHYFALKIVRNREGEITEHFARISTHHNEGYSYTTSRAPEASLMFLDPNNLLEKIVTATDYKTPAMRLAENQREFEDKNNRKVLFGVARIGFEKAWSGKTVVEDRGEVLHVYNVQKMIDITIELKRNVSGYYKAKINEPLKMVAYLETNNAEYDKNFENLVAHVATNTDRQLMAKKTESNWDRVAQDAVSILEEPGKVGKVSMKPNAKAPKEVVISYSGGIAIHAPLERTEVGMYTVVVKHGKKTIINVENEDFGSAIRSAAELLKSKK